MAKSCYICDNKTIFYIWSSSRHFPKRELIKEKKAISRSEVSMLSRDGVPVCFDCYEKLKKKDYENRNTNIKSRT